MIQKSPDWLKRIAGRYALSGILAVGLAVRLVNGSSRGIEYDDAFSIFLSARSLPEIVRGTAADTMPPLYYLILHFWMQVSASIFYLRFLSILLSLVSVYLLYGLVEVLAAKRGPALIAAFLAAVSPFQFYHAQDLRNYALLLAAQLGYTLFFARIWRRDLVKQPVPWSDWAGIVACGLAAMYTHNMAVFGLAIPTIYLLATKRWRLAGKMLLSQLVIGILYLPWLLELPSQIAKIRQAWWLWRPGIVDLLQVPIVWSAGLPLSGIWLWAGLFIGIEILALLVLFLTKNRGESGRFYLIFLTVLPPAFLFGVSYLIKPVFVPRVFILSAMAFLGLAGWAIHQSWGHGPGKLIFGGFVLASVIGLPSQFWFRDFPRSPFEQAAAALAAQVQAGEVVVHDNKLSYFPFHYYAPALSMTFLGDPPGSENDNFAPGSQDAMDIHPAADLATAVGQSKGVYFVVFTRAIAEYHSQGIAVHPSLAWLMEHYSLAGRDVYNDLEIYHFTH